MQNVRLFRSIEFRYRHNLPESPPDSGSEPPYSPPDPGAHSPRKLLTLLIFGPYFHRSNIHSFMYVTYFF